ncbi:MAG: hypothetical protein IT324_33455 [Anaerolineae bacterium]|nr:hypothetical protein [Anaerolineae bacterium]
MSLSDHTNAAPSFSTATTPPAHQVSRRTVIKAGWVVPTVVALELSGVKLALAVSGGGGNPPPQIKYGCSLGYWKNNADKKGASSWTATGYTPTQLITSVFNNIPAAYQSLTLLAALGLGGGGDANLLRQGVAAVLNASHPSVNIGFPLTAAQVISQVSSALGTSSAGSVASTLESYNKDGQGGVICPLNNS